MNLERYSVIGITFSAVVILIDLYLLKKHKVNGSTFTRWFIIGVAVGGVSLVPAFFTLLYVILGTDILISAVTAASFMILLLLVFYMDYRLNELNDKVTKLVAKMSADDFTSDYGDESKKKGGCADEEE